MRIVSRAGQRRVPLKRSSFRGLASLRTVSGSQQVESQLENDLVTQLAFSPSVQDIVTQPIIRYRDADRLRTYTPDVYATLWYADGGYARAYLIEVKRAAELERRRAEYAAKFEAARRWVAERHGEFRIVTERELRTPYLANARQLSRWFNVDPDSEWVGILAEGVERGPMTVSDARAYLRRERVPEAEAYETVVIAVANRMVDCDLAQPFGDGSLLADGRATEGSGTPMDYDPFLRLLKAAPVC